MGLSSSQARLLHLTARMHQIEYKAAKLEAQKLQMANESRRVYEDYLNALEATKIQCRKMNTDGSMSYEDATYNKLVAMGYVLKMEGDDKEIVTQSDIDNYLIATDGETSFGSNNRDCFAALQTGRVDSSLTNTTDGVKEIYTANQLINTLAGTSTGLTCRLMGNIDMSGTTYTPSNLANCQFDGNGYSITGLSKALIGTLTGTSSVRNLSLSGNVDTQGMLANTVNITGSISNVSVSGTLNHTTHCGGLIGEIKGGTVEYCRSSVSVYSSGSTAGGFIGKTTGASSSSQVIIHDCISTGSAVCDGRYVGGFIGQAKNTKITDSVATGSARTNYAELKSTDIYGTESTAGGFIGIITGNVSGGVVGDSKTEVTNCSASGDVYTGMSMAGGFVGHIWGSPNSVVTGCQSSGTIYYNCAAETPAGVSVLETWALSLTDPGTYGQPTAVVVGGFVGSLQGGQVVDCDSSSTIVNKWTQETGGDAIGTFCGTPAGDRGDNVITNCYTNNTSDTFVGNTGAGSSPENTNVESTSAGSAQTTTVTPASAPAFSQVRITEAGADDARALFDRMHANGYALMAADDPRLTHGDDPVWLRNMINEGMIYLFKPDSNSNMYETSVATDTNLREVDDETNLRKAEAKYEADMRKIDQKDRRYDTELAALDGERNALKSEMDTLKNVAKDNVERTFKLFS